MSEMPKVNYRALKTLKAYRSKLNYRQYKTIRGQILSGDDKGAMKGLRSVIERRSKENCEHSHIEKQRNSAIITAY